jgi:hypothetical protein
MRHEMKVIIEFDRHVIFHLLTYLILLRTIFVNPASNTFLTYLMYIVVTI